MLKKCPFCGEKPNYDIKGDTTYSHRRKVQVKCPECGASTKEFGNVSDASTAWNNRTAYLPLFDINQGKSNAPD